MSSDEGDYGLVRSFSLGGATFQPDSCTAAPLACLEPGLYEARVFFKRASGAELSEFFPVAINVVAE